MIGKLYLKLRANKLGKNARLAGKPYIERAKGARIHIGDDFVLSSQPVQSHLVLHPNALVEIGSGVRIASGAAIACTSRITIGDRVELGRGVMMMDTDFHDTNDREKSSDAVPITIEDDVVLGDRVVVLKGAHVERGARIGEGSVVSGRIPAGVFAAGVPARTLREKRGAAIADDEILARVLSIVAETFHVAVDPKDGPERIPAWDSLGSLRLLLALEDDLGVMLDESTLAGARSVEDLARVIASKPSR